MSTFWIKTAVGLTAVATVALAFTFERPPVVNVQHGFRGTGMDQVFDPRIVKAKLAVNGVPDPEPTVDPGGTPSSEAYQNVQVLGNLDSSEFLRLMAAITTWVSPQQGCNYCHNPENLADDSVYTKRVARRMLQMTLHLNANWKSHVAQTGVTCYTCHRGMPVPANVWFNDPGRQHFTGGMAQEYTSKDLANPVVTYASLPADIFTPFLDQAYNIRVASTTALPDGDRQSIKQTEWTYGLMIHFANSLGVNCSYCHNTRAFSDWSQSSPQRTSAWYGIRMVRDLNNNYLEPLQGVFPPNRLGPLADVPKINCATCHQGVYKPLYGVSMLKDYPELDGSLLTSAIQTPAAVQSASAQPLEHGQLDRARSWTR